MRAIKPIADPDRERWLIHPRTAWWDDRFDTAFLALGVDAAVATS